VTVCPKGKVCLVKIKSSYRLPLLLAIIFHVALIVALSVRAIHTQYRWHAAAPAVAAKPIVQASAVDQKQLNAQIKKIKWEKAAKQRQELRRLREIEHRTLLAKNKRAAEERRVREIKHKQAELQRKQVEMQRKQREQQHQAELKAQKLKKQIKQMRLKKLADQQKDLQEKLMRDQLQSEQKQLVQHQQQLSKLHAAEQKGVMDKYRAQILQAIQSNWHPLIQDPKLSCQLLVHLGPGGVVTQVEILHGSGNGALDRSARVAVLKSSPLPVPKDSSMFDQFRRLRINMSPQEIKGMS